MSPTLVAVRGDITRETVDAVVNAANTGLVRGGGVCGAIFAAAGPDLDDACAVVAPCPPGEARVTPGFGLAARWIVHAVGPVWRGVVVRPSVRYGATTKSPPEIAPRA